MTSAHFQDNLMLYDAYEVQRSLLTSASKLAGLGAGWLNNPTNPFGYSSMGPLVAAGLGRWPGTSDVNRRRCFMLVSTRCHAARSSSGRTSIVHLVEK